MALLNNDVLKRDFPKRDLPQTADWYIVSDDGLSALRISHGLQLGETTAGTLVLNPQEASQRWIEFDLGESGAPSIRLVATDRVMLLDNDEQVDQYPLSYGVTLQLPDNTLYVGHDIAAGRPVGPVLRIEQRGAPDWQALMGDILQQEAGAAPAPDVGSLYVPGGRGNERSGTPQPGRPGRAAPARRGRRRAALVTLVTLVVAGLSVAAVLVHRFPAALDLEAARGWLTAAPAQVEGAPAAIQIVDGAGPETLVEAETPAERETAAEASVDVYVYVAPEAAPEAAPEGAPEGGAETDVVMEVEVESPASVEASASDDWRLEQARLLIDQGHITHPPEDNAVALLSSVLADHSLNAEAMALMGLATHRLLDAAARAHAAGDSYEARNLLEEVFGFNPYNQRANLLWEQWVGQPR